MSNTLSKFLGFFAQWRVLIVCGLFCLSLTAAGAGLGAQINALAIFNITVGVIAIALGVHDYYSQMNELHSKIPEGQR